MGSEQTGLVPVGNKTTLQAFLKAWKPAIAQLRPSDQSTERLLQLALVAAEKTPALLQCTADSFRQALYDAARLGLDPTGLMGQGYLVPYKDRATFIVGYRGLIDLVQRGGGVSSIGCNLVHQADAWDMDEGLHPRLTHKRRFREEIGWEMRGECVGGYCCWTNTIDQSRQFFWLFIEQIERVRRMSKKPESGPWRDHWGAMSRKTILRAATKFMPMSTEVRTTVATALAHEDAILIEPDVEGATASLPADGRAKPGEPPIDIPVEPTEDGASA